MKLHEYEIFIDCRKIEITLLLEHKLFNPFIEMDVACALKHPTYPNKAQFR